jgi:hypothetical protein
LQKVLVNDLAEKQFSTWRTKTERYVGLIRSYPMPDASSYAAVILDGGELERIFGKNRFAKLRTGVGKWALPPGTQLEIKPPKFDSKLGELGTIHLKNSLCDLSVRTTLSAGGVGLANTRQFWVCRLLKRKKNIGVLNTS